jgi:tetratricopeptide (TPR) repeat protein
MNTSRDTLWQLVKRLNPAEKRYFRTHFASPNSQQTALFDLLNAQQPYNEVACRMELDLSPAHYKVLKVQLQDLLLRSLMAQQGKRSLRSKIRLGLEEVDLLLERELFREAVRRLRRLDQTCQRYGFTLYRYEITEKLQAITQLEIDVQDEEARQYYQQLQHLQRTLNQKEQLHAIQTELEAWTPFKPHRFTFGQRLLAQLEQMPAQHLDFQSRLEWMQNTALCYEILGQERRAQLYRSQILNIFAQDDDLGEHLPFSYLRALRYQATPLTSAPNRETVRKSIEAAHKLVGRFPQYSPHLIYFYWADIRSKFYHHQWLQISGSLEHHTISHLQQYELGNYALATDIYLVLACTYLILSKPEKANYYLNQLARSKPSRHPYHILAISILQFVLCWEKQEYNELARLLRNHQRRLARRELLESSSFAYALLAFFRRLSQRPTEARILAAQFLLELSAFSTDSLFPFFSFLHLERWLQALAGQKLWRQTFS